MSKGIFALVIAYGFPSLLLVIGFLIYSGGSSANMFVDASEQISLGKGLMGISVILYIIDSFILFLMWSHEQGYV